jgi:uncharacterized phiE125 gp8 family phage protein
MSKPRVIDGPYQEPVTLTQAKAHCRVDDSNSDTLITSLIVAARETAENYTERTLCQRTYKLVMDRFPFFTNEPILLRYPPIIRVDHVKYESSGSPSGQLTWDAAEYAVDTESEPGRIRPLPTESYPSDVQDQLNAVEIQYVAGYRPKEEGSPTDYADAIPQAIKQAILLIVGHLFEHREDVVIGAQPFEMPMASQHLLHPYRVLR